MSQGIDTDPIQQQSSHNRQKASSSGEKLLLDGAAGVIEAQISYPEDFQRGGPIAVICHPHPLYGGSMSNKVVFMISRTFIEMGVATLCFNFRGVGKSQGSFDEGRGESEDLQMVVDWFRQQHPDSPVWLAGFSFGAYVAAHACEAVVPERLLLVAPPVSMFDFSAIEPIQVPYMVVQGAKDEIISPEVVGEWVVAQSKKPTYHWMSDAGHFFHGNLNTLRSTIIRSWGEGS